MEVYRIVEVNNGFEIFVEDPARYPGSVATEDTYVAKDIEEVGEILIEIFTTNINKRENNGSN